VTQLDRDVRALRTWLRDEGLIPLPEWVAEAVLQEIETTSQRRGWLPEPRNLRGLRPLWLPAAAAVLAVSLIALALWLAPVVGPTPSPSNPIATLSPFTATPEPTPPTSASTEPLGAFRWEEIGTIETPELTDGSGGFVALGFDDGYVVSDCCAATTFPSRDAGAVRFSTDGARWEPVELRVSDGYVISVMSAASDGQRVVLAGEYTPCTRNQWLENPWFDCRSRPATWVTDDGRTWRSSPSWSGLNARAGQAGSWFTDVWPVPGMGWEAAQVFSGTDESDDLDPTGPALWRSTDGLTWSLLAERIAGFDLACGSWTVDRFRAFADVNGNRIAVVQCDEGLRLWHASDGVAYSPIEGFPAGEGSLGADVLPPTGSEPWLFGGLDRVTAPVIWSSSDLQTWTTIQLSREESRRGRVMALALAGGIMVAIGGTSQGEGPAQTTTWASPDGQNWVLVDMQPGVQLGGPVLANGPTGTLRFGSILLADDTERFVVWRLDHGG
jgi:hypothetical protein